MTQDRPGTIAEADRAFKLATHRQNRRGTFNRKRNWLRSISSRSAHRRFYPANYSRHRIVTANVNPAIVSEKQIANPAQDFNRLGLVANNRLLRSDPAGHHERQA